MTKQDNTRAKRGKTIQDKNNHKHTRQDKTRQTKTRQEKTSQKHEQDKK